MNIGEKIKQAIDRSHLTNDEIADKIGVSTATLYNLVKKESVETKYLERLSKLLNIDIMYFIDNNIQYSEAGNNIQYINTDKKAEKTNSPETELTLLHMKIEKLEAELELKNEIITLLKEKKS